MFNMFHSVHWRMRDDLYIKNEMSQTLPGTLTAENSDLHQTFPATIVTTNYIQ